MKDHAPAAPSHMTSGNGPTTLCGPRPQAADVTAPRPVGLPVAGPGITIQRLHTNIDTGNGPLSFHATVVAAGNSLLLTGAKLSGAEGFSVRAIRGTGALLKFFSLIETEAKAKGFKTLNWEYVREGVRPDKEPRPKILKRFMRSLD